MTSPDSHSADARWTLDALRQGAVDAVTFAPGLGAFAMAFGTVAARKGFTLFEAMLMSGSVFAGVAQMVALDNWPEIFTTGSIIFVAALTALINARYLMIGATLRPLLGGQPPAKVYSTLFVLVEPSWIASLRYHANGGRDPAYLLGGCLLLYAVWVLMSVPGFLAGTAIGNPQRFGIDLVMPAFFVAMLVPLWRGRKGSWGLIVGASTAVVVEILFGGFWYVLAGAMAGCLAGVFNED